MRTLLPTLFFVFTSIFSAAKQTVYPSIYTVVDEFYKRYSVDSSTQERRVHFAKKKAGWVFQLSNQSVQPEVVLSEMLFWSAEKKAYVPLPLSPGPTADAAAQTDYFFSDCGVYNYERCSCYGYSGWYSDVIADIGNTQKLNDTLLESLGRAYASAASVYADRRAPYLLPLPPVSEQARQDSFIRYSRLEIATFDRLRKQTLKYDMIAGNPTTKYANEVMDFYDQLIFIKKESLAIPYFKEELYDPLLLAFARNMLVSCDSNAILFTNGDNDTFPLEYLQVAKGVRTDVTIVNMSLLGLSEFVALYAAGKQQSKPVKLTLPVELYQHTASEYFVAGKEAEQEFSVDSFFTAIRIVHDSGTDYCEFSPGSVSFETHASFFGEYPGISWWQQPSMRISGDYFTRSGMAQLDIVLSNYGERPVYYLVTTGKVYGGIENFLFCEGLTQRFIPGQSTADPVKLQFGNLYVRDNMYRNLFLFTPEYRAPSDKTTLSRFVTNSRLQFTLLALSIAKDRPDSALALLQRCETLFPAKQWGYEPLQAYQVMVYYACGKNAEGDRVATGLMDMIDKTLKDKNALAPTTNNRALFTGVLNIIREEALAAGRDAIAARALKMQKEKLGE